MAIDVKEIFKMHLALMNNGIVLDALQKRGIEIQMIRDNMIGIDMESGDFTLPLKNEEDLFEEIVKYSEVDELFNGLEKLIGKHYKSVSIQDSIRAENHGKNLIFDGISIGKDLQCYLVPRQVRISCEVLTYTEKCYKCPLNCNNPQSIGVINYTFIPGNDKTTILQFVNQTDNQVIGYIKKFFQIPQYNRCQHVKVEIVSRQDAYEALITSEIDYETVDTEYTLQRAFFFNIDIRTNTQYRLYGTTVAEPFTQQAVHIITAVRGSQDHISKWKITPDIDALLRGFQPADQHNAKSILEKQKEIYTDFSYNITKIFKRTNVLMAMDLVYHSVLTFKFLGEQLSKGWTECLVAGDTRTGKTETLKNLIKHYRAGEFITSGENTTLAGILGGVQQTHGNKWSLTWGKLPLNDRRAVIIDEADNLAEKGIIGHLSGVRSSGIAELVKIQTQRTLARTRIIWIANPLNGNVKEYTYGVKLVKELFDKNQDISRLDFAIICAKDDMRDEEINKRKTKHVPHIYTSEMCNNRVMFAWTRKLDDIIFESDAEELILKKAVYLGDKYSADIPLIIGAEMRIKLARLSVAMAIMMYSVNDEGKVVVTAAHVEVVIVFLELQYDSSVFGYSDYSFQKRMSSELKEPDGIDALINSHIERQMILACPEISLADIEDIFGCNKDTAKYKISRLRKCGALKKCNQNAYKKTPAFIRFLKDKLSREENPYETN